MSISKQQENIESSVERNLTASIIKITGTLIIIVCMTAIGFVAGRMFESSHGQGSTTSSLDINVGNSKDAPKDLALFDKVWNTMQSQYVDKSAVNTNKMFYGAIKGMVSSYNDPATIFLDPTETDTFNKSNEGKYFEGIGAELGYLDGVIVIISPITGSPAEAAGIKPGDAILKVDGVDVKTTDSIFDIVAKIRGNAGTIVKLTVLHKGATSSVEISITRGAITVPSMKWELLDGNIAKIDISRFTDTTIDEWANNWDNVVEQVKKSGATSIILDLRGNPGGYFDAAVYAANDFLTDGKIIAEQKDKDGKIVEFKVTRTGRLLNYPVVVLVNGGSASASEILTGALQKNGRAKVIGENSYGKGTAQQVITFADGSSLHITTLKWLLPDGTWINHDNTIKPDIEVKNTDDDFKNGRDPQKDKAIETVKTL